MEYSLPFSQVFARRKLSLSPACSPDKRRAGRSKEGKILLRFDIDMASGIPPCWIPDVRLQLQK
jgi:hypothetical protein